MLKLSESLYYESYSPAWQTVMHLVIDITCFSPSLNLLCLITNSHTVIKTFIRPQHDGWKIEEKLISQKNICVISYLLDKNDIINNIILPVFWGPNSVYQTPTGSQSLQRWGSPSIIFCSHSSFLPSTNSYMRSSYTPQQRNRKIQSSCCCCCCFFHQIWLSTIL